jgi:hypothetical protein
MTLRQSVPQRRVSEENGDSYGRFPGKCGRRSVVALVAGHGRRRHCRCSVRYSSAAQTASGLCPVDAGSGQVSHAALMEQSGWVVQPGRSRAAPHRI